MSDRKPSRLIEFFLMFAVVYLLTQLVFRMFFPQQSAGSLPPGVFLKPQSTQVKGGHHPVLMLENRTDDDLTLADRCPLPPVDVFFVGENEKLQPLTTNETALPCAPLTSVPAGAKVTIDLSPWKYSLFGSVGTYEVHLPLGQRVAAENETDELSARFAIYEPGVITQAFRTFITKPFLNLLILIASLMPDHSLGLSIIILTLLIKFLLFFPTQHAMEGQKKLQKVQPRLDALKERHKNDPQRLQQETMKVWKEEKINPLQSCLPMLLQFPILIGLFFTVRDGSILALSQHLLYAPYQHLSWTFGTNFFGFDLLKPSIYIFPPVLVILQFLQMKLSFALNKKKQAKQAVIDASSGKKEQSPQQTQQIMMLYGMPLMIGFFALKFPAAVSLYWGISTLFAIGQQIVVNRRTA